MKKPPDPAKRRMKANIPRTCPRQAGLILLFTEKSAVDSNSHDERDQTGLLTPNC
jgi:hypothetical protein